MEGWRGREGISEDVEHREIWDRKRDTKIKMHDRDMKKRKG